MLLDTNMNSASQSADTSLKDTMQEMYHKLDDTIASINQSVEERLESCFAQKWMNSHVPSTGIELASSQGSQLSEAIEDPVSLLGNAAAQTTKICYKRVV